MNQYQEYEIASIQSFANLEFPQAVEGHEQAQTVMDNLAAYIAKKLIRNAKN